MGREILKTRSRLRHLASVVISVYGPQSRTAFQFQKMNDAMDRLCLDLESQAEIDCPGLDAGQFYR
jgi:hypothetical protein